MHLFAYLGEVAQELRLETLGHSQRISINQHLTVTAVTRSNTNSYGFYLTRYFSRQLSRNLFQNDGKNTCLIQGDGIADELLGLSLFLGTDAVAAKLVDALWGQSQMTMHRNTGIYHRLDGIRNLHSTFELQGIHARLLHHAASVAQCFLLADLITAKRHIAYHKGMLAGTCHAAGMVNHLVYGDRQGISITCHHVAGRIANQDTIDACCIQNACSSKVISCKHRHLLACRLHLGKRLGCNLLLICR